MSEYCSNVCLTFGLNSVCDNGMGGIVEVAVTNWAPNLFIKQKDTPSSTNYTYVTTDAVEGGKCGESDVWYKFSFRRNTGSMSSTANVDEANGVRFIETELNLAFNRMDKVKRESMMELMKSPCACVVQDTNNNYWALGVDEPVVFTAGEGVTGTNRTDANQYTLTLTDISEEYPWPVQNGKDVMDTATY